MCLRIRKNIFSILVLCGYYIINSTAFFLFDTELLIFIFYIWGELLVIVICCEGSIRKKFLSAILNISFIFLAESIVFVLFIKINSITNVMYKIYFSTFIYFIMEIIIEKIVQVYKHINISLIITIMLILIPIGSIYVASCMIEVSKIMEEDYILSLCSLLAINIFAFVLYEKIIEDYVLLKNKEMNTLQLKMYKNQIDIMQQANDMNSIIRHDIKHHLFLISDYIYRNENKLALQYIEKINGYICKSHNFIETGNKSIDSILNYIVGEVHNVGGEIKTEIIIPENLNIEDFDINIILGNLLMNAYEAIKKSELKEIFLNIRYDRGILKIKIINDFNGIIKENQGKLITTKDDEKLHGVGIKSVKRMIEKYNGHMQIKYRENKFEVTLFLFIPYSN